MWMTTSLPWALTSSAYSRILGAQYVRYCSGEMSVVDVFSPR